MTREQIVRVVERNGIRFIGFQRSVREGGDLVLVDDRLGSTRSIREKEFTEWRLLQTFRGV